MTEPTPSTSKRDTPEPAERVIAAPVNAGLAGLLSSILALNRVSNAEPVTVRAASPDSGPGLQDDYPVTQLEEQIVLESNQKNRLRLRHAEESVSMQPLRLLNSKQLALLLEALAALQARPGEEGLPAGMLVLDIRSRQGHLRDDQVDRIRLQIDAAVRNGDVAVTVPDIGIVLFCGGLFFPGDLEVMGARVRRRALDGGPVALVDEELHLVMAGAMSFLCEDPITFVTRGVAALDESVVLQRQDIVIEYGGRSLDKLS